jgi:ElaB/YqjD/DUF883 family membrane-anchored ribosome-binding protein
MDQRDIEEDVRQIVETRTAISEKLALLKHRINETVRDSQAKVDDLGTHLRETAASFIIQTKQQVDPRPYLLAHPWGSVCGAVVIGFVMGQVASQMASRQRVSGRPTDALQIGQRTSGPAPMIRRQRGQSSVWQHVSELIKGEIEQVKEAAIERGRHMIYDVLQGARTAVRDPAIGKGPAQHAAGSEVSPRSAQTNHTLK